MSVEFLHAMVRVTDIDAAVKFYGEGLGLSELLRYENEQGRFTLVFLASPDDIERCGGELGGCDVDTNDSGSKRCVNVKCRWHGGCGGGDTGGQLPVDVSDL